MNVENASSKVNYSVQTEDSQWATVAKMVILARGMASVLINSKAFMNRFYFVQMRTHVEMETLTFQERSDQTLMAWKIGMRT